MAPRPALASLLLAAAALPAGFAPPLWLGSTALVSGDTAKINAVAYDSSSDAITGDMIFSVDGATIGSAHFSLAAGASAIESANWTATQGTHKIGAALANVQDAATNAAADVADETIPSVTVVVAAAPPPPIPIAAASAAAGVVNETMQVAGPVASSIVSSVADAAESARLAGAAALSNALLNTPASTLATTSASGEVLGTSTYKQPSPAIAPNSLVAGALTGIAGTSFGRALERGALAVFESAWLFYLIILVALLGFFWWLKRRLAPPQT